MALNIGLAGHSPLEVYDSKQTYLQNDLSSFFCISLHNFITFYTNLFLKFELRSLGVVVFFLFFFNV